MAMWGDFSRAQRRATHHTASGRTILATAQRPQEHSGRWAPPLHEFGDAGQRDVLALGGQVLEHQR